MQDSKGGVVIVLIGTFRHQLDAKNRFRVPTKLKAELGTNFIITKGSGGCLFAFSAEGFEDLYQKVSMLPLFDEEAQKPVRKFLASAFEIEEDTVYFVFLRCHIRRSRRRIA